MPASGGNVRDAGDPPMINSSSSRSRNMHLEIFYDTLCLMLDPGMPGPFSKPTLAVHECTLKPTHTGLTQDPGARAKKVTNLPLKASIPREPHVNMAVRATNFIMNYYAAK